MNTFTTPPEEELARLDYFTQLNVNLSPVNRARLEENGYALLKHIAGLLPKATLLIPEPDAFPQDREDAMFSTGEPAPLYAEEVAPPWMMTMDSTESTALVRAMLPLEGQALRVTYDLHSTREGGEEESFTVDSYRVDPATTWEIPSKAALKTETGASAPMPAPVRLIGRQVLRVTNTQPPEGFDEPDTMEVAVYDKQGNRIEDPQAAHKEMMRQMRLVVLGFRHALPPSS